MSAIAVRRRPLPTCDTAPRPLLFSPALAAQRPPRPPRCPDIYMLGPGMPAFTLADLIQSLTRPALDERRRCDDDVGEVIR